MRFTNTLPSLFYFFLPNIDTPFSPPHFCLLFSFHFFSSSFMRVKLPIIQLWIELPKVDNPRLVPHFRAKIFSISSLNFMLGVWVYLWNGGDLSVPCWKEWEKAVWPRGWEVNILHQQRQSSRHLEQPSPSVY